MASLATIIVFGLWKATINKAPRFNKFFTCHLNLFFAWPGARNMDDVPTRGILPCQQKRQKTKNHGRPRTWNSSFYTTKCTDDFQYFINVWPVSIERKRNIPKVTIWLCLSYSVSECVLKCFVIQNWQKFKISALRSTSVTIECTIILNFMFPFNLVVHLDVKCWSEVIYLSTNYEMCIKHLVLLLLLHNRVLSCTT